MSKPRASVYIDGSNIYYTQQKLGWRIDWQKMKQLIEKEMSIIGLNYYGTIKTGNQKEKVFLDKLKSIGFKLIIKPLKKIQIKKSGKKSWVFKGNFDVEMAIDIILNHTKSDYIILFSGDSDFVYLIEKLFALDKKVIVYASHPTVAWEITKSSASIVFLEKIKHLIKMPL